MVYPIDPVGYYSWARSILIDGDLNVANEFAHYGMGGDVPTTPTGYKHNQWPAGSGVMWLPFMGLAHWVTRDATGGFAAIPDGYGGPYVWAASMASTLFGLGALLLIYFLAKKLFGNFVALLSTMVVWLSTPLVYYQYHEPLFAHANDVFWNTFFVVMWWFGHQHRRQPVWMVGLGAIIGAAVWVRTQNIILLFVVMLEIGYDVMMTLLRGEWRTSFRRLAVQILSFTSGFLMLAGPLMLFWRVIYGAWVVNTYQATGGGTFDWRAPHLLDVLASTNRGLFVWAPITILSVVGMRWLYKTNRRLTFVLGGVALFQLYVVGSWSHWAGGAAFGPRFWIALTPLFVLAIAALIHYLRYTISISVFALVVGGSAFIVWNFLLMAQYVTGMIEVTGTVNIGKMIKNQYLVIPRVLERVIQRLR
jgi:hypothetical protein